jgi:hypothetical protein
VAVGRLFTNTSFCTVSGTAPRSEVEVDSGLEKERVVSMDCLAVGWAGVGYLVGK